MQSAAALFAPSAAAVRSSQLARRWLSTLFVSGPATNLNGSSYLNYTVVYKNLAFAKQVEGQVALVLARTTGRKY